MSILADWEIENLCTGVNKPMIDPFISKLIRHDESGNKVISYGLTSYGYDIRLANEVKLFSNHKSIVIDPLNMDPECLIDMCGDFILIPPNSYILGRSIEYFQMPLNVTGNCLGKSTYARCFTGDTKIQLTDGTTPTFLELIERVDNGENVYGYSLNKNLSVVGSELVSPRKIGHEKVIEITLDEGEKIKCTFDHKFITRFGEAKKAINLKIKDALFSIDKYKIIKNIQLLEKTKDVYCLTAPIYGNFALANGVFVNNCGLQINVTPLEAGWCGHLVIEISNATSSPVKIYTNQGIAQIQFHAGKPCDVTYADRGGKYQGQTGITLAK